MLVTELAGIPVPMQEAPMRERIRGPGMNLLPLPAAGAETKQSQSETITVNVLLTRRFRWSPVTTNQMFLPIRTMRILNSRI